MAESNGFLSGFLTYFEEYKKEHQVGYCYLGQVGPWYVLSKFSNPNHNPELKYTMIGPKINKLNLPIQNGTCRYQWYTSDS